MKEVGCGENGRKKLCDDIGCHDEQSNKPESLFNQKFELVMNWELEFSYGKIF